MNNRFISIHAGVDPAISFKEALALESKGNLAEAENIYRAILKRHPDHLDTLQNLTRVLLRAERFEEATRFLRKLLNQKPTSAQTHTSLAYALHNLERYGDAQQRARRAIALNPEYAPAYATLAGVLADLGSYDEAIRAQARAIELGPDRPLYYYQLGNMTRWIADDPRLAALEALAQKSGAFPIDEQINLEFALAKAYADCGDLERAFRRQLEGGKLKRRTLAYDEAAAFSEWEALCRTVDVAWLRQHRDVGDPSPQPVFILGMPRSGTTLVEQILASHPKVWALGENPFFHQTIARVCGTPTVPPALPSLVAQWSGKELRQLGRFSLEAMRPGVPTTATRISDKLPVNFVFAGLIHAALPNARIIHTCRDPIDTCLSIFSILFAGSHPPYSYDLGELGRYYRSYEKIMAHWRSVLPEGVMIDVQYEDVVTDVEQQARRIIAHCGLEWDDACLAFHKTDRPVRTASHTQVRQPIYRSSVGRQRPPHGLLQPLLQALGRE
jgi:tetratricopeptide (TPR) repeat protein